MTGLVSFVERKWFLRQKERKRLDEMKDPTRLPKSSSAATSSTFTVCEVGWKDSRVVLLGEYRIGLAK